MERTNHRSDAGDVFTDEQANVVQIKDYMAELGERAVHLRARTEDASPASQRLIFEALEVLQNGHEELAVADEEMRQQNVALVRMRNDLEEALRHARELFELAPDAYLVTDAEGMVREANAAAARLLNIRASFLIGKPLVGFVVRQDCRRFRAILAELTAAPHAGRFALRMRPRHGRPVFTGEIAASAVRSAGGASASIRWSVREHVTPAPGAPPAGETRASRLVTDLLALLDDARDGDDEALDWRSLVERAVAERRSTATSPGPELEVLGDGERCRVVAHPERIVVALGALIDDALDAEAGGRGVVRVTVGREGALATVRVGSSVAPPEGAIGQRVARRIVRAHGGSLTTSSDGAGGFQARVAMPLSGAVAAMRAHPVVPLESSHADLHRVRVLVVEDDDDSRELLVAVLEGAGAEVEEASNAADAVSKVAAWRPDVLVSDIGLPGRDGYDLVREVRALGAESGGGVPAIALTGYSELEDSRRAIAAGFQVHVGKPIDPALLTHAVANVAGMKVTSR